MRLDANDRAERTAAILRSRRQVSALGKPRKVIPRQVPPRAIEREYARELVAFVEQVRTLVQPLLDDLPGLAERARAERMDAGEGQEARRRIAGVAARLRLSVQDEQLEQLAQRFADRTSRYQRAQLDRQLVAGLGAEIFISDRGISALRDGFVSENVALIRNVPEKIIGDLERTITRGLSSGTLHKALARQVRDVFDVSETRAKLIARDQINKFYGQVNESRQKEIGVDSYIWRTVRDERVRDEHAEREGERYTWSEPPDDGHPGQPIQCRCYAEPDFSGILGASR